MSEVLAHTALPAELACPRCHAALAPAVDGFGCAVHGTVGSRSSDGVWDFDAPTDAYWGEVSRDLMRRINGATRRDGWQTAVETLLGPAHPDLVPYVQHPARGDWSILLPLDRSRTVAVDVGAGWGANSFALAPQVARVYAVEKIPERVEFIGLRAAQENAAMLVPVRADLHALPFAPGSIDVFAVNGVLEWAGLVDPDAAGGRRAGPRVLQERFLRQLWTLLRPGGWLYVGIENRFGRMFLTGAPDHQGLRWTSLMPKPLARAYTWTRGATSPRTHRVERSYRTYIYSFAGYRQLLAGCGFGDIQRYAVLPGYNVPTQIVSLESPGPLRWLATRGRSMHRWRGLARRTWRAGLAVSGVETRISSCYALVARRPPEASR